MNFLGMGPGELMVVMVLALIVFGPGKLPEIGQGIGKAIREFRKATSQITDEFSRELSLDTPPQEPRRAATPPPQETQQAAAAAAPAVPVVAEEKPPLILEIKRPVTDGAASAAPLAGSDPETLQTAPAEATLPEATLPEATLPEAPSAAVRAPRHRRPKKPGVEEEKASGAVATEEPTNA
jgi:TatA/E family protein of Tat protein translocase